MSKFVDLTGQRFGRLVVIERKKNAKGNKVQWLCKCDCGNFKIVLSSNLKRGLTRSCGCIHSEQLSSRNMKHGESSTRLYKVWCGMIKRCYNENSKSYKNYGGRGIIVCNEWLNNFRPFYDWSMSHGYSDDLTIDRIDVNGNYTPDNCRWTTVKVQSTNRRNNHYITYNGKTQTMKQWALELGIKYTTLANRINYRHWTIEKAFSTP